MAKVKDEPDNCSTPTTTPSPGEKAFESAKARHYPLTSLAGAPPLPGVARNLEIKLTPIGNQPVKNPLLSRIIAQGKKSPLDKTDGVCR